MTLFLCLDMATCTGICYGRPDSTPVATAIRAPVTGDDYGAWGSFWLTRFAALLDQVEAMRRADEPLIVAYERPILPEKRFDKVQGKMVGGTRLETTIKLQSLVVLLETACTLHPGETDVRYCNVTTIKRELAGSGKATKDAMVYVARRAGIALPDGAEAMDAADAFGIFLLCVRHHAPKHQQFWDRRLYSHPGVALL